MERDAVSANHPRRDYALGSLTELEVDADPIRQFASWYAEAERAGLVEPYRMVLATASAAGEPSARIILMRGCDEAGFRFFTNERSRKGRDLATNPLAALVFDWYELERQVRVEGRVERLPEAESDAYFRGRPLESRLGAWASDQSDVVVDRQDLEARFREVAERFGDGDVPRPPHWGGFRVVPASIEFWQGRPNRLHDRIRYRRDDGGGPWVIERLAP